MIDLTAEEYGLYLLSEEWKEKRQYFIEITGGMCSRCPDKASILHHLTYEHVCEEPLEDLEFLCRRCHNKAHLRHEVRVPHFAKKDVDNKIIYIT